MFACRFLCFVVALAVACPVSAEAPRNTPRHEAGPPLDGSYRETPIFPWDDKAALAQIDALILRLDQQGIPDDIRQMAVSEATEISAHSGQTVKSRDVAALDMIYPPDGSAPSPDSRRAGRYLLLHSAREGNPWALYTLAHDYIDAPEPDQPPDVHVSLFRLAADREFQPAIVNFILMNVVPSEDLDPAMAEAYLRYGFDLNMSDGGYQLTLEMLYFYHYDHPNRPDDGYFQRGLDRLQALGAWADYTDLKALALLDGSHLEQDVPQALALLTELLGYDDPAYHHYTTIGYHLGAGLGVPRDPDRARDFYVACLQRAPTATCALNLASYFRRPSDDFERPVQALVFYELARSLALEEKDADTLRLAEEEIEISTALLPLFGVEESLKTMRRQVAEGQFTKIFGLTDVRPVP
jgi:TPR repeat protein